MPPNIITNRSHPLVRQAREIRDGRDKSFLFCEGPKSLEELLSSSVSIRHIFSLPTLEKEVREVLGRYSKPAIPIHLLVPSVMDFVSDVTTPPGVVAIAKRPVFSLEKLDQPSSPPFYLMLYQLQLPQNVGALLRTAEAAGVQAVFCTRNTADPFSPKSIRASAGSVFRLPIYAGLNFPDALTLFEKRNITVVTSAQTGKQLYTDYSWEQPCCLLVGAEGEGFSSADQALIKNTIRIPMKGRVESLNVAAAAAICLFESNRQRELKRNGEKISK